MWQAAKRYGAPLINAWCAPDEIKQSLLMLPSFPSPFVCHPQIVAASSILTATRLRLVRGLLFEENTTDQAFAALVKQYAPDQEWSPGMDRYHLAEALSYILSVHRSQTHIDPNHPVLKKSLQEKKAEAKVGISAASFIESFAVHEAAKTMHVDAGRESGAVWYAGGGEGVTKEEIEKYRQQKRDEFQQKRDEFDAKLAFESSWKKDEVMPASYKYLPFGHLPWPEPPAEETKPPPRDAPNEAFETVFVEEEEEETSAAAPEASALPPPRAPDPPIPDVPASPSGSGLIYPSRLSMRDSALGVFLALDEGDSGLCPRLDLRKGIQDRFGGHGGTRRGPTVPVYPPGEVLAEMVHQSDSIIMEEGDFEVTDREREREREDAMYIVV